MERILLSKLIKYMAFVIVASLFLVGSIAFAQGKGKEQGKRSSLCPLSFPTDQEASNYPFSRSPGEDRLANLSFLPFPSPSAYCETPPGEEDEKEKGKVKAEEKEAKGEKKGKKWKGSGSLEAVY